MIEPPFNLYSMNTSFSLYNNLFIFPDSALLNSIFALTTPFLKIGTPIHLSKVCISPGNSFGLLKVGASFLFGRGGGGDCHCDYGGVARVDSGRSRCENISVVAGGVVVGCSLTGVSVFFSG